MVRPPLPDNLLRLVSPQDVCDYARATGWRPVESPASRIILFNDPDGGLAQLLVPRHPQDDGYDRALAEVVARLAEREGRSAADVLEELLFPGTDVLHTAILGPTTTRGSLPLDHGVALLGGLRDALRASACAALGPATFPRGLTAPEVEQFLEACRLRQTEREGFTFAVACPVRLTVDTPNEPFGRRALSWLMAALDSLSRLGEGNGRLAQASPHEEALLLELALALLGMRPDVGHELVLSVSWARTAPAGPLAPVRFDSDQFEALARRDGVRKASSTPRREWVGMV